MGILLSALIGGLSMTAALYFDNVTAAWFLGMFGMLLVSLITLTVK